MVDFGVIKKNNEHKTQISIKHQHNIVLC
jgi:hypothetical protein